MKKTLAALLLTGLVFISCSNGKKQEASAGEEKAAPVENVQPRQKLTKIIDFSATWCPPCQQLKPIFHKLQQEYEGKVEMVTVDVDENSTLANEYNVESIPALIYIDAAGNEIDRTVGFMPEEELKAKIDSLL